MLPFILLRLGQQHVHTRMHVCETVSYSPRDKEINASCWRALTPLHTGQICPVAFCYYGGSAVPMALLDPHSCGLHDVTLKSHGKQ